MKKLTLTLLVMFGAILASCGGMPALQIIPPTATYIVGDPVTMATTDYVVISDAPAGSVVHYTLAHDGTTAADCTCSTGTVYQHDTDIPIYVGTTSVNAVACDANGPVTSNASTFVTLKEAL